MTETINKDNLTVFNFMMAVTTQLVSAPKSKYLMIEAFNKNSLNVFKWNTCMQTKPGRMSPKNKNTKKIYNTL